MLVICYITKNGEKTYSRFESVEAFSKTHPDAELSYAFDESADIIDAENSAKKQFALYAPNYGFEPSDYMRKLCLGQAHTEYLLVGFIPRNRKYKCRIYDPAEKKYYKISATCAHDACREYDIRRNGFDKAI